MKDKSFGWLTDSGTREIKCACGQRFEKELFSFYDPRFDDTVSYGRCGDCGNTLVYRRKADGALWIDESEEVAVGKTERKNNEGKNQAERNPREADAGNHRHD